MRVVKFAMSLSEAMKEAVEEERQRRKFEAEIEKDGGIELSPVSKHK